VDQLLSTARGSCSNELRDSDLADRVRMTVNVSTLGEVEVLLHDAFNKVPYGLCLKRVMEGTSLSRNAETYLVEKGFVLNR
jgi:hypothetical protein